MRTPLVGDALQRIGRPLRTSLNHNNEDTRYGLLARASSRPAGPCITEGRRPKGIIGLHFASFSQLESGSGPSSSALRVDLCVTPRFSLGLDGQQNSIAHVRLPLRAQKSQSPMLAHPANATKVTSGVAAMTPLVSAKCLGFQREPPLSEGCPLDCALLVGGPAGRASDTTARQENVLTWSDSKISNRWSDLPV